MTRNLVEQSRLANMLLAQKNNWKNLDYIIGEDQFSMDQVHYAKIYLEKFVDIIFENNFIFKEPEKFRMGKNLMRIAETETMFRNLLHQNKCKLIRKGNGKAVLGAGPLLDYLLGKDMEIINHDNKDGTAEIMKDGGYEIIHHVLHRKFVYHPLINNKFVSIGFFLFCVINFFNFQLKN